MIVRWIIITTLVLSSLGTLHLFLYSFFKLKSKRSLPFVFFLGSVFIYILGYAFEISQDTIEGIFLALKIEYIGIPYIAVFWFLFSVNYCGCKKGNTLLMAALFIIPAITTVLLFTNNYHNFHYKEFFM